MRDPHFVECFTDEFSRSKPARGTVPIVLICGPYDGLILHCKARHLQGAIDRQEEIAVPLETDEIDVAMYRIRRNEKQAASAMFSGYGLREDCGG